MPIACPNCGSMNERPPGEASRLACRRCHFPISVPTPPPPAPLPPGPAPEEDTPVVLRPVFEPAAHVPVAPARWILPLAIAAGSFVAGVMVLAGGLLVWWASRPPAPNDEPTASIEPRPLPEVAAPQADPRVSPPDLQRLKLGVCMILGFQEGNSYSVGTGFALGPKGRVVTNWHVVQHATRIVLFWDPSVQREPEEVFLADMPASRLDLAVLSSAAAARVGDYELSEAPVEGTPVYAIGFPLRDFDAARARQAPVVTAGILSTFLRDERGRVELIQTDAPINAGNSGGPLFERDTGRIVGVVTLKLLGAGIEGQGFAVPSAALREAFGSHFRE